MPYFYFFIQFSHLPAHREPHDPAGKKSCQNSDSDRIIKPRVLKNPAIEKIQRAENRHRPEHWMVSERRGKVELKKAYPSACYAAAGAAYLEQPLEKALHPKYVHNRHDHRNDAKGDQLF